MSRLKMSSNWLRGLLAACAVALALAACGGGDGGTSARVGTGGTGAFSVGAITGFGSVIVNGLRFEDASATVSDEDGPRSRSDLKLGMVVKVEGTLSTSTSPTGTATNILFDSELLGPVKRDANGVITVIGQKVALSSATVFDASLASGAASIQDNNIIEVHGFLNPQTNELQATFIEKKSAPNKYKISGEVKNLQTATFQIGSETISFAGLSGNDLPSNLANGMPVKVRLQPTAPAGSGTWTATRVRQNKDVLADKDEAEVEGLITAFTSTSTFSVGNVPVNAAGATFRDGSAGLALGARVEVKGAVSNGVLQAKEVKLEDDGNEVELKGNITSITPSDKTFVLRGQTVSYGGAVQYKGGGEANLAVGRKVEVKALIAANSSTLSATEIEFEN